MNQPHSGLSAEKVQQLQLQAVAVQSPLMTRFELDASSHGIVGVWYPAAGQSKVSVHRKRAARALSPGPVFS